MQVFLVVKARVLMVFLLLAIMVLVVGANDDFAVMQPRGNSVDENGAVHYVDVNQPYIALTFDDGPNPLYTRSVLDVLREEGVLATFFVVGSVAEQYPRLLRQVLQEGHEVENHGYRHTQPLTNSAVVTAEIIRTNAVVYEQTGVHTRYFRPPLGRHNRMIVGAAAKADHTVVMWSWSQDTRDWEHRSSENIAHHVLENARPGDIVLMHDDNPRTVAALHTIINGLKSRHYRIVTISELMGSTVRQLPPNPLLLSMQQK